MKPKLPREFLWTDFKSLDEFFILDPVNGDFYVAITKIHEEDFIHQIDAVKVFNEVYYQVTRMSYENTMPYNFYDYLNEIKTNIGWSFSVDLVMSISYYIICINKKDSLVNDFFKNFIKHQFSKCSYWRTFRTCFERLRKRGEFGTYDFKPKPNPIRELETMYIHWDKVTQNYSAPLIKEVLRLFPEEQDKQRIALSIEAHVPSDYLIGKKASYDKELQKYFFLLFNEDTLKPDINVSRDDSNNVSGHEFALEKQKKEIDKLKSRISELELENEQLKSLQGKNTGKEDGEERIFTLTRIVDYCKNRAEWADVRMIVAMLNKLLFSIGTQEDSDLVDSIEAEFINRERRKYGDTVMGDKNTFEGNSSHNTITLPLGMTQQEAMKLLLNKSEDNGEEG